jgi:hypothetical protein
MLNGVALNCSYVAMCTCRCVHRTIKRPCDAIYEACYTGSKCCAQMLHRVQSNVGTSAVQNCSCANIYCLPFCAYHLSLFHFFTFHFFHVYIIVRFFTCSLFCARAASPAGAVKQGEHLSNFSVFPNDINIWYCTQDRTAQMVILGTKWARSLGSIPSCAILDSGETGSRDLGVSSLSKS